MRQTKWKWKSEYIDSKVKDIMSTFLSLWGLTDTDEGWDWGVRGPALINRTKTLRGRCQEAVNDKSRAKGLSARETTCLLTHNWECKGIKYNTYQHRDPSQQMMFIKQTAEHGKALCKNSGPPGPASSVSEDSVGCRWKITEQNYTCPCRYPLSNTVWQLPTQPCSSVGVITVHGEVCTAAVKTRHHFVRVG